MSACLQVPRKGDPNFDEEEAGAALVLVLDVEPRPRSGVWSRRRRRHPWRRFGLVRMCNQHLLSVQSSSVHFRFSHVRACGKVKLYAKYTPNSRGTLGTTPLETWREVQVVPK